MTHAKLTHAKLLKSLAIVALAVTATWLAGSRPEAQGASGITFSGTAAGTSFGSSITWPAGPDYATDVLGNPWDFSDIDDVDRDPGTVSSTTTGWSTFDHSTTAGTVGGSTTASEVTLGILFSGYYNVLNPG